MLSKVWRNTGEYCAEEAARLEGSRTVLAITWGYGVDIVASKPKRPQFRGILEDQIREA